MFSINNRKEAWDKANEIKDYATYNCFNIAQNDLYLTLYDLQNELAGIEKTEQLIKEYRTLLRDNIIEVAV